MTKNKKISNLYENLYEFPTASYQRKQNTNYLGGVDGVIDIK